MIFRSLAANRRENFSKIVRDTFPVENAPDTPGFAFDLARCRQLPIPDFAAHLGLPPTTKKGAANYP
jgi:hypothetical protein